MTALHAAGGGLPLALHIPHVVEQAGSLAGFAAVVGLAILSALYFSQARDLRRLREWAGRAPERAAEGQPAAVPGRVVAVPQRAAQPVPHPTPGPPAAAAPAPANGAPAAADKPAEGEEEKKEAAATAASNGDAAPSVTAVPAGETADEGKAAQAEGEEAKVEEPAAAGAQDGSKPEQPAAAPAKPAMPAPASAAAAAGATAASVTGPSVTKPAGSQAPAGAPAGSGAQVAAGGPPASSGQAPTGAPTAPGGPPRPAAGPQRPPGSVLPPRTGTLPPVRRLPSSTAGPGPAQTGVLGQTPQDQHKKRNPIYVALAVVGVLILGAAAAIGVPALVNGTKDNTSSSSPAKKAASTTTTTSRTPAVAPDKITVAVLNGTSIPGLAAQVGDRVDAEGFTLGTVSNASPSQGQRANSVAMYAAGHERDASRVARKLGIHNVERIDANSRQIAGDASVVVIVGSDKTQ
jgi:LytR cell envelope-related transcriptional attenuator